MKELVYISLLLLFAACNNAEKPIKPYQRSVPLNQELKSDTLAKSSKNKNIEIGYVQTYDSLPELQFDTISESEFKRYKNKRVLIKPQIKEKGNYFFIPTKEQKHAFKKYDDYGEGHAGFEFVGYYPKLKLFALTENSSSEGLEFGQLFLLDSITDYRYSIISFGDANVTDPIPSPGNKYMVYYYNSVYEHKNCDIGILKINSKSVPESYLKEYASYHSDEFAVEELIWVSDNSFYIKGYEEVHENDQWVKKYKFYRTVIQGNSTQK